MKTKILLLLSIAALFLASCSKVQVSQDFDSTYNFAGARTYNWNTELQDSATGIIKDNTLLADRFVTAINTTLTSQGFSISDNPDFLVSYTYQISSRLQTDSVEPTLGFGYGRYGRFGGVGIQSGSSVRQYDRGLLTISIHDNKEIGLVWKGDGTREVFTHSTPEQLTKTVNELVESTLAQFPPLQ